MEVHENIVLLHENMFKNIDEKLTCLIKDSNERADRFDKHILESLIYRNKVDNHEEILEDLKTLKWWLMGTIITILTAVMSALLVWGATQKQIQVNTDRITQLEFLHPRVNYAPDVLPER